MSDNQTTIPNLFEVIDRLLTGKCTNQQARHWAKEHFDRAMEQQKAEQEPGYLRSVKISEDIWNAFSNITNYQSLAQSIQTIEHSAVNALSATCYSPEERAAVVDIAAYAMFALHQLDERSELDAAGGVN
jgi:hypothetical protein